MWLKGVLLAAALALSTVGASAQCSGNFNSGEVCGNSSASDAPGARRSMSAVRAVKGDYVNVADYGAAAAASAATNTTAFTNALAAGSTVYCPDGVTYSVNEITVPANTKRIFGKCTLNAATTMTANTGIFNITGRSGVEIDGPTLGAISTVLSTTCTTSNGSTALTSCASTAGVVAGQTVSISGIRGLSTVTSAGAGTINVTLAPSCGGVSEPTCGAKSTTVSRSFDGIQVGTSSNLQLRNMTIAARYGVLVSQSDNIVMEDNTVSSYLVSGLFNAVTSGSHSNFSFNRNVIGGGSVSSTHCITAIGGFNIQATANKVTGCNVFGVSISATGGTTPTNFTVSGNNTLNTIREGINVEGGANGAITGNTLTYDATSEDIGLSIFAPTGITISALNVTGNTIVSPGSAGLVVNSSGGTITNVKLSDNLVVSPNARNLDSAYGGCIDLFGSGTTRIEVTNNWCRDLVGNMKWQVIETNDGVHGNPSNNVIGPNNGPAGTSGINSLAGAGTVARQSVVPAAAATSNQWVSNIALDGTQTKTQPAASNLSNGVTGTGAVVLQNAPRLIQNVGIGTETNAQCALSVSLNVTTGVPCGTGGTLLGITPTDASTLALYGATAYGGAGSPTSGLVSRGARGTAASPSQIQANDILTFFGGQGYTNAAAWSGTTGGILVTAVDAFTSANQGTTVYVRTTPSGTTATAVTAAFHHSSGMSVGGAVDPGSGALSTTTFVGVGTKIRAQGAAPALSSCGTTPAITGSDLAGTVTMGTGAPTGCVITFNAAYASAPYCTVTWRATPLASQSYTVSTSAITLTQTGTSSNVVDYHCMARSGG